jgi:hypothetical protein
VKIVHTNVDRKMKAEKIMMWNIEEGFFGLILRPILSGKENKVKKHSKYNLQSQFLNSNSKPVCSYC